MEILFYNYFYTCFISEHDLSSKILSKHIEATLNESEMLQNNENHTDERNGKNYIIY